MRLTRRHLPRTPRPDASVRDTRAFKREARVREGLYESLLNGKLEDELDRLTDLKGQYCPQWTTQMLHTSSRGMSGNYSRPDCARSATPMNGYTPSTSWSRSSPVLPTPLLHQCDSC